VYRLCPSLVVLGIKRVKGRPHPLAASMVAAMDDDAEEGKDDRDTATEPPP
jgi:hypothetical protein